MQIVAAPPADYHAAVKFGLIDRIVELERGKRIVAVKAVSLSEEYLADHFPTFPVLPGVLMLEAMVEAAAWLVRDAQAFAHSLILLRSARNVTYKSFVRPGQVLRLEVTCRRLEETDSEFDGVGTCDQVEMVKARFGLTHGCVGRPDDGLGGVDEQIAAEAQARFALLGGQQVGPGCPPGENIARRPPSAANG